jgi:hypothetical protein
METPKVVEIAQYQAQSMTKSPPEELVFDSLIDNVLKLDDIQLSDFAYVNAENVQMDDQIKTEGVQNVHIQEEVKTGGVKNFVRDAADSVASKII